jgi:hypothetical protein
VLCDKEELGYLTGEARRAQSKEFLIKNYSDLCELTSVVKRISDSLPRRRGGGGGESLK